MKISKRTREQAWLICAIAASTPEPVSMVDVALEIGLQRRRDSATPAARLACQAWCYALERLDGADSKQLDAEAAALLAEGWCPP